jgi:crossover junction endodeoxyribonuclease RusA
MKIPYPPSVNHYYRNGRNGQKYISKEGVLHRQATWAVCRKHGVQPTRKTLSVHFVVSRPDKRIRDLSNLLKCLEDSLTKGGMWHDDSQIVDLRIAWVNEQPEQFITIEVGDEKT